MERSAKSLIRGFLDFLPPPLIRKPLPEVLFSDSGPAIQLFNLQKYLNTSGPYNVLLLSIYFLLANCISNVKGFYFLFQLDSQKYPPETAYYSLKSAPFGQSV
jgi:hypothetical protein